VGTRGSFPGAKATEA